MCNASVSHLRAKYTDVKTNHDGMFLGVLCERQADGYMKFTKPFQVMKIIDNYLPEGLTTAAPKDPMTKQYLDKFGDSSPLVDSSKFRSLLGALMQLNDVRADLVFPLRRRSLAKLTMLHSCMSYITCMVQEMSVSGSEGVIGRLLHVY